MVSLVVTMLGVGEVEGFAESTSSSAKNSDFEEEEVDLNSLIEGDVDEIDEELGKKSWLFLNVS